MSDEKPERLGLRGRLAHMESGLRLLGGANATGAIAAGVGIRDEEREVVGLIISEELTLSTFGDTTVRRNDPLKKLLSRQRRI
jgi:hypothetical protein